jgi:hypothetical protein
LLKAEDPFDQPKDILDFGANAGLAAVGRLDRLINALASSAALVGKVLRSRRAGTDRGLLSAVSLIACRHASNVDQLFGEHDIINQMVATPTGVQSSRRFTPEPVSENESD